MRKLLEVENLVVHFETNGGLVEVLDDVNFTMHAGEILGLVGESGSGKSVSALAILGMIRRPGRILAGSIRFEGVDLLRLSEDEMSRYRGRRIAMISQSHRTSLNPIISAGRQISVSLKFTKAARARWRAGARWSFSILSAWPIPHSACSNIRISFLAACASES